MTDQELMELMLRVDPQAQRIPPGIRAIIDAVAAAKQVEIDELKRMDDITMTAFNRAVDRAEMAEARIATLEQQRQQDFEAKHQPNTRTPP